MNKDQSKAVAVTTIKWFGLCSKCALLVISLMVFGWGVLTAVPTQGHQAGRPSILQRLTQSTTVAEQLEAERRIEAERLSRHKPK